jgi:hypothetical protein
MALRDTLRAITTPIEVKKGENPWTGTGFFFQRDRVDEKGERKGIRVWLITNRHVLFGHVYDPNQKDELPDVLTFYMRCQTLANGFLWRPVTLPMATLAINAKLHTDPVVDVVAIEVTNEIGSIIMANSQDKFAYAAVKDGNTGEFKLKDSNTSINLGVGINALSHLEVGINYNIVLGKTGDLTVKDAATNAYNNSKSRTNAWQLNVAYFF